MLVIKDILIDPLYLNQSTILALLVENNLLCLSINPIDQPPAYHCIIAWLVWLAGCDQCRVCGVQSSNHNCASLYCHTVFY